MATQRPGKGSKESEEDVKSPENETSTKKEGLSKKQRMYREQQKFRAKIRWGLAVVLLVLLAIGLYYYFSYYQINLHQKQRRTSPPKSSKHRQEKATREKAKTNGNKASNKKKASGKVKKSLPTTDKKKSEDLNEEIQRLNKVKDRILRQPISANDPDRPYAIDFLTADNLLLDRQYQDALQQFNAILGKFPQSPRAQFGKGITLTHMAREKKSNKLLDSAVDFFRMVGLDSILTVESIRVAALVAMVDKAQERGKGQLALRGMEKLVELRSENIVYANKLGILYLSQEKTKKARSQFKKIVDKFEENHFAKAQLGYILYMEKHYEKALSLLLGGIRHNQDIKYNGNFYNYAGDTLTRLNRSQEAFALYGEGVAIGLFPSVWQRSLVNERGLRGLPWWSADTTGYMTDISRVEKTIDTITNEALAIFNEEKKIFQVDNEKGSPHYLLFSNGKKNLKNCLNVPKTCALMETIPEAVGCKRGTIKFSSIPPQTHIAPHVGHTNTKLQVMAGLKVDPHGGIRIRIAEETKILGRGQIGIIDESFEKEVWYVGEEPAVYLTIDVWHPDLSYEKRQQLGSL